MKKYTKQEVIDGDFAIEIRNEEEFQKVQWEYKMLSNYIYSELKRVKNFLYLFPKHKTWDYHNSRTTSITLDQIDFEEEFVLPESWHIIVTEENKDMLSEWRGVSLEVGYATGMYDWKFNGGRSCGIRKEQNPTPTPIKCWETEITTEQFRKYVLNQKENMKTPIGYKAPYDLFGGKVKKGTVYLVDRQHSTNINSCSFDKDEVMYNLPKELVEQWEPVYKKQAVNLKISSSSGDFNVRISEDGIQAEGETISIQALYQLKDSAKIGTNIGSWEAFYSHVTIGCKKSISLEEITRIITEYEKFNS